MRSLSANSRLWPELKATSTSIHRQPPDSYLASVIHVATRAWKRQAPALVDESSPEPHRILSNADRGPQKSGYVSTFHEDSRLLLILAFPPPFSSLRHRLARTMLRDTCRLRMHEEDLVEPLPVFLGF